jgi:hypothetical protein
MPDGVIVKETEVFQIPLLNLDSNQPGYTLYSKKYSDDIVYYDILSGLHFQDTLTTTINDSDSSLVAMPLAFIYKLSSTSVNPTSSLAAQYSVTNLGVRGTVTYNHLPSPIPGLYQDGVAISNYVSDTLLFSQLQPSPTSGGVVSYIQLFAPDNHFLKAVTPVGRRYRLNGSSPQGINFSLKITSSYLKSQAAFLNNSVQYLNYEDPVVNGIRPLLYQTFVYPIGSKVVKDLLSIEVINLNPSSGVLLNTTPFELNEIIVSTLGIFG